MFPREDKTDRFYDIEDHPGPEEPAIVEGLRWLVRYASEQAESRGTLVLQGLDSIDYLARTIGQARAKHLRRNRVLQAAGVNIDFCTTRDLGRVRREAPVLFLWADGDGLTKLDDRQPMALCAVASGAERIDAWLRTWSPQPLREDTARGHEAPAVSPTSAAALSALTVFVNLGSGLAAPEDRAAAIDMFRKLIEANEPVVPAGVRSWAATHGWTARGAQDLETVATDLLAGKRLRARDFNWPADAVERWRAASTQHG